jgi:hypothetical protein
MFIINSNLHVIPQRVELKRLEYEWQCLLQRKMFEDQMRALEQQQAQELLSLPPDPNAPNGGSLQHLPASAPTTPPCVNVTLNEDNPAGVRFSAYQAPMDAELCQKQSVLSSPTRGNQ